MMQSKAKYVRIDNYICWKILEYWGKCLSFLSNSGFPSESHIFLSEIFFGHLVVCGKFYSNDLMQGARNWAIIGIGQHLLFWSLDGAGLINNILPVFVLTNYDCWQISIFVSLLSISLYITFNSWHCYSLLLCLWYYCTARQNNEWNLKLSESIRIRWLSFSCPTEYKEFIFLWQMDFWQF